MQEIKCPQIGEKMYIEILENGLKIMIIPKRNTNKKYIMYGPNFGSVDNRFIMPDTGEEVFIPDGVAHFLEHKMFEQKDGTDSLYELMALGIDANAYTTRDHTAFLFECTDHFYEGLDILMDYVQNPYFTDENVEKEKGIIGQEIMMYDDDPGWQLYMNTMDCLYKKNPIKIDIAGSIESISKIDPEVLNKCYKTFYNPSNMLITACGDFDPETLVNEIKKRIINNKSQNKIERIYPTSDFEINKKYVEKTMPISMPIFMIGYKDRPTGDKNEIVKKHIAIEILLNLIIGESSELYSKLAREKTIFGILDFDYEFSEQYAHILISGQSKDPLYVNNELKKVVKNFIEKGLDSEDFERIKKKIYGSYVMEYNEVSNVARMFFADSVKGINSFDYIEKFGEIDKNYTQNLLKNIFEEKNEVFSIIKGENND